MRKTELMQAITEALHELERRGDIVFFTSGAADPASYIFEEVKKFVKNHSLTASELAGIKSLIVQAVNDESFFDWEMSNLTGFNTDGFREIAEKLPAKQ